MKYSGAMRACVFLLMSIAMFGCKPDPSVAPTTQVGSDAVDEAAASKAPVKLEDVLDITPDYVIGISYPEPSVPYPELAAEMQRYAEGARAEFLEAVQSRASDDHEKMLYDLSLNFTQVADSPQVVAYAAEGSSFTGGAHGTPLLARFVWLPQQDKRLGPTDLVPGAEGWEAIAAYVREELHTALSQRVDADELGPGERAEVIKSAGRMIDEGTTPDPGNFASFEPVVNADGNLTALRFVFAPYQVGPYADGVQTVEVPAAVLLPHVASRYRDLFVQS